MSLEIPILFEDEYLIAVNKPAGLIVHTTDAKPDVVNLQTLLSERLKKTLILFHRLDRDTSGVVLLGKRRDCAGEVTRAFEERRVRKAYFAVVEGEWPRSLTRIDHSVETVSGPKKALTTFRVLAHSQEKSWLEAILKTGRKHQIRIHCKHVGHPVLGDRLYGNDSVRLNEQTGSQALHAYRMDLRHPVTKQELTIRAPVAKDWTENWLQGLEFESKLNSLYESAKK